MKAFLDQHRGTIGYAILSLVVLFSLVRQQQIINDNHQAALDRAKQTCTAVTGTWQTLHDLVDNGTKTKPKPLISERGARAFFQLLGPKPECKVE